MLVSVCIEGEDPLPVWSFSSPPGASRPIEEGLIRDLGYCCSAQKDSACAVCFLLNIHSCMWALEQEVRVLCPCSGVFFMGLSAMAKSLMA